MAPQPQRAQDPHHLDAKLVPLERALLARSAALETGPELTLNETPAVTESNVKRILAREFRALAEELHYW